jgi:threonine dehydrogenase-like Zn-dependent dehydrogenase
MKAAVWHDAADMCLDAVPEPIVEQPTDALVQLAASGFRGPDGAGAHPVGQHNSI